MIIVIAVIALLVWYFFNRNRVAPPGTYDDKDYRSGGSIGGGQRTYDDPDFRSGGSIGGGPRTYDDPDFRSSGSIGAAPPSQPSRPPAGSGQERPRVDSEKFKSGGSIGG
jgi:hypothetical protein